MIRKISESNMEGESSFEPQRGPTGLTSARGGSRPPIEPALQPASRAIRAILEKPLADKEVSRAEAEKLFGTTGTDKEAVLAVANELRHRANGNVSTFVITRNINFTNICYMGCKFCNFRKRFEDEDAEFLSFEEIVTRAQEAWNRGATEVCIQGGLHPKMGGEHYRNIVIAIKESLPDMHIHAFSPFEIWFGSKLRKMTPQEFVQDLKDVGLGSVPGTAAEILDTEIRQQLTKDKLPTKDWIDIIKAVHAAGLKTSATIMYGHIDGPAHWAAHIDLIRSIQKETGGFTEFVPLGFVHYDSPLFKQGGVRPGPTEGENEKMHAISRIMLHGHINNIQVSWVKMGPQVAQNMLNSGVNDLGGTLMNETISRAAGSPYGQEITAAEMVDIIRGAGQVPAQRNTKYEILDTFTDHNPKEFQPLVARTGDQQERLTQLL